MSDNDNMLSQAEIDALMKQSGNSEDDETAILNEEEIDVLGEVGNIAMGSAATALNTILNQKVDITTPQVSTATFAEIVDEYSRPCVLVNVDYIAGLEGANLLIIKEEDAAIIADLMMGGNGIDIEDQLDEIRLSAVGEAMNQMMGSASTSLSSIIGDVVNISPPETHHLNLDQAIEDGQNFFNSDDVLVETAFQLKIGDLVDSSFKQLAPLEFTKQLVSSLTSGGLVAKDDEIPEEELEESETAATLEADREDIYNQERTATAQQTSYVRSGEVSQQSVGVQRAQFPNFDSGGPAPLPQNMELIQDVPLQVTVRLGKCKMTIKEILDLGEGSIVELDKLAGEAVDLLVNGKLVAKGEVVVIDENFGFRVKDIISPMERINNI